MSTSSDSVAPVWGQRTNQTATVARNVASRYMVIGIDALIGLLVLPFNIGHLGQSAWGLWMLTTSISSYFTVVDLGYGGSITKYVATYRARRDPQGINEITSTLFVLFAALGAAAYGIFVLVAFNVEHVFNLSAGQTETARVLLLITGTQLALGLPFGVFGGVVNGFQRYDVNNVVSIGTSLIVAAVNVTVLWFGYGLVSVVLATTLVRLGSKLIYRLNAYRVFPLLSVRPSLFRIARLREVSGFSVYISIIDWSNRLSFASDALIIGAFLSPAAVALWAVPRRLAEVSKSLTNPFNTVLLPIVVDSNTRQRADRLQTILIDGTRLSLFMVTPIATGLFLMAQPLIRAWVGPDFAASVPIAQILAIVVIFRVGNAPSSVLLKGAGRHKLLAVASAGGALANIGLSLFWIRSYGLPGLAMATLIPIAAVTLFVVFPAACRLAGVGIVTALRQAIWPVLWPLPVMIAVVKALRAVLPTSLPFVMLAAAAGALCYVAVFVMFAVGRAERANYLLKIRAAARRQPMPPPKLPRPTQVV
ncbi:MAG: oligosaccharide flippase family protein [Acidobacteriota bacterium]|nr:oligosaccharide flippase family protein [Acidobacteriota bacterium]